MKVNDENRRIRIRIRIHTKMSWIRNTAVMLRTPYVLLLFLSSETGGGGGRWQVVRNILILLDFSVNIEKFQILHAINSEHCLSNISEILWIIYLQARLEIIKFQKWNLESLPLTYGSGSESCYFRHWP